MNLPEINVKRKSGNETFLENGKTLNFNLADFWSWNQSTLVENRTRGILAEFIVKQALEIKSEKRIEWDNYDLITNKGRKLEIKSAAYIQSWKQESYSRIQFDIAATVGAKDNEMYDGTKRRWADFYVFCLLKHKDQNTINPLNLNQWIFYVLETEALNKQRPTQKKISLGSLMKLDPTECKYSELKNVIDY